MGTKTKSLRRQPQSLVESILAIERDDKKKSRRLNNYPNGLVNSLGLELLEL